MPALSRFMDGFLNADQVALGRLVLDTKNPSRNFCKANSALLNLGEADRTRKEFKDIYSLTKASSSFSFEAVLTKLLSILATKSGVAADSLETARAVSYELLNVDDRLKAVLADEAARRWVETYKKKSRVYLVVALHTVQDASVSLDHSEASAVEVKGTVPASAAVDAAIPGLTTAVPAVADAVDPKVAATHSRAWTQSASFVAPGERIIAVGYLEVKLRSFFSCVSDGEPALAKKTVWRSFDTSRGAEAADMVEAALEEVATAKELGKGAEAVAESTGSTGRFVVLKDQIKE